MSQIQRKTNYLTTLESTISSSLYQQPTLSYTSLFKLADLPIETSNIRLCKNYLDTFKEPLEEKQYTSKRQQFSKSVPLERRNSANEKKYKNYERMLAYSANKKRIQDMEQLKRAHRLAAQQKAKKTINLKEIVENKMNEELMGQNECSNNELLIEEILKDNQQKQQLFQQSIFVDKLIEIKKQSMMRQDHKLKNIEYKPKYFHLNQKCRDINTFYRRKFTRERVLFRCERLITSFQSNQLMKKQQQHKILMHDLMKHYSQQVKTSPLQSSILINQTIKRLFLHYSSNEGAEESYTKMSNAKLKQFLKDFDLKILNKEQSEDFLTRQCIQLVDFTELVYSLGSQAQSKQVYCFIKDNIMSKSSIYIPIECHRYLSKKEEIQKYYKTTKMYDKLQRIYQSLSIRHLQYNGIKWLNFDNFHELMLSLKIYPTFIQKSRLKYYYLYIQQINKLIKLEDLKLVIAFIALTNQSCYTNVLHSLVRLIKTYQI